jgi:hypothetical protein
VEEFAMNMSTMQAVKQSALTPAFWLGFAAYVVPSFPIAYVWHLVMFAPAYHELAMYRDDVIVPFGLLSMFVQGAAFSYVYPHLFPNRSAVLRNGLLYGLGLALLSWSFTTLAVAAKNVMTSVPTYMALETSFTVVQFAIAGPLIALAYRK